MFDPLKRAIKRSQKKQNNNRTFTLKNRAHSLLNSEQKINKFITLMTNKDKNYFTS